MFKLFNSDVPRFSNSLAVDLDGGKFEREDSLYDAGVGLLYDLDVEGIAFLEFCNHRTDMTSCPARRVVKVESQKHGTPP